MGIDSTIENLNTIFLDNVKKTFPPKTNKYEGCPRKTQTCWITFFPTSNLNKICQ